MPDIREIAGTTCVIAEGDGAPIADAKGVMPLIEAAFEHRARVIAVPVERLDPAFFQLRSGVAGAVLQKGTQYRTKFAVVGDITSHVAASDALRDFVVECERGDTILFVPDIAALEQRLSALAARADRG